LILDVLYFDFTFVFAYTSVDVRIVLGIVMPNTDYYFYRMYDREVEKLDVVFEDYDHDY
jgi:hypothetical protein